MNEFERSQFVAECGSKFRKLSGLFASRGQSVPHFLAAMGACALHVSVVDNENDLCQDAMTSFFDGCVTEVLRILNISEEEYDAFTDPAIQS